MKWHRFASRCRARVGVARRSVLAALIAAVAALPVAPALAADSDAAWKALAEGGKVALIRHEITDPGVGDPAGMRLDDCRTQRNLTEQGRRDARALGDAFRSRGVPIERVLSSPWCRCLETARLAFGAAEVNAALGNLFGRPEQSGWQVQAMRELVAGHRARGNLVLVSHGSTISALTGVSPEPGEIVVVTADADGRVRVVARVVGHRY